MHIPPLFGIFLLLHVDFKSTRLTLLVLVSLPFALVGGVIAAFLGGGVLSLGWPYWMGLTGSVVSLFGASCSSAITATLPSVERTQTVPVKLGA